MANSPEKEVGPKVHAGLHGVFPPVNVPNLHEDYLVRR